MIFGVHKLLSISMFKISIASVLICYIFFVKLLSSNLGTR